MTTVTRTCAKCGAKIFAEAPQEFCSACFLRTGLHLLTGEPVAGVDGGSARRGETINAFGLPAQAAYSAEAAVKAGSAQAGERVPPEKKAARPGKMLGDLGDYELQEEIGRGGQGLVYRARQKSLNRTVALKVIGLGYWATEEHVKRFRLEAEAAARLEHPGIVPIHEVGERDALCYFSMKFVEGGQLDEVARREPMQIRRAAELVTKIARTVHYAHEHGILHRDIKPGNILLDANGEPHLTDFGLARLVESESTVTRTREVLGTPSYMAPEQAAGETTNVSRATDVYGLGAVLYELLTSHPPFAGGTSYETIRLLLDIEPRQPRLWNPKIDRDLSTICLKCLEKDPQRRYSSALALAEDLEHWLKHEPIQAKPTGFCTHARKWVRRNPSTTVLVTLLLALAGGLSVTVWKHQPAVVIPKSVAVLPFENLSDNRDNSYFAEGIQEEILTRLASITDLKVISRTSTQRYHSKPGNLAEIAKQLGVANIVEGSVQKTADQVRVNVQLINAQTDSHLWADSYDRKLTNVLGVESEIAKRIAESLQAKLTGQEQQALAAKPTNNADAYDAYLRGVAFEARNHSNSWSTDLLTKAVGFYKRAAQLDPNFGLAWARLSRANGHLYFAGVDTTSAAQDAKLALENAQRLEPSSPEALLALGYYQYWVLRDYGSAKTTFGHVSQTLPGSSEVLHALALVTRRQGSWDKSTAYFEQALDFDPRDVDLLIDSAETYAALRQFPAALKLYDRVLDITPNDPGPMALKASIYQAQGNLREAARSLPEINLETSPPLAFGTKISQLKLERNFGEAIRLLQARLAQFHYASEYEKTGSQVGLAWMQRLAGDTAGAKVTAEQARNTLEQLDKSQLNNSKGRVTSRSPRQAADLATSLSKVNAVKGEKDAALKLAGRAIMLLPRAKDPPVGPAYEENLAVVATMFGDNDRAISILTQLLQTPYTRLGYPTPITQALLRLDPIWDPLRADPRFQKLCEEKIDRSVAVLPFENLSRNPDNAYFAEGIQEEILTRLAKIADLKVISRTSTQRYHSKPGNLAEIAKQLGVANIVEGSVQKVADQVRVNIQLINAQTDSHLWAETYDRKLTDILGVESEIAKGIAESLQARLTGREQQALAVKPTNNPEAYDAYLRGLAVGARAHAYAYLDLLTKAIGSYQRAVQIDPGFALAWAQLSRANAELYLSGSDITFAAADNAKLALENAQKLEPNSPETLLALGYYQYYVLRDYGAAKITFGGVGKMLPGSSEVPLALAMVTRREGSWDESAAYFEQALALNPRDVESLINSAACYAALRQFPAALKLYDRALDIMPNDPGVMALQADMYQAQGKLQEAAKALAEINLQASHWTAFSAKIRQLKLERNFGEAIRLLQARLAQFHYASEYEKTAIQLGLVFMQRFAGDAAGAKVTAEQARNTLEQLDKNQSNNSTDTVTGRSPTQAATVARYLSIAYAALGEKDSALKEAERAIMLLPRTKDATLGPGSEEVLAFIQTMVGENSRAISTLTQLLRTPYAGGLRLAAPITPALLRLDPFWDPLRGDPAFQKLCEEKQK